jgi:RNA 3'-terminal phosphate cyclase
MDWFTNVYVARIAPLAETLECRVPRRGFSPGGGGRVDVVVDSGFTSPPSIEALRARVRARLWGDRLVRGEFSTGKILSLAESSLGPARVAERQAQALATSWGGATLATEARYVEAHGRGSAIMAWVEDRQGNRLGADDLGEAGRRAESVGAGAGSRLKEDWESGATVDRHLADHLAPWIALGAGAVRVPDVTPHLATNVWTCQQFLGESAIRLEGLALRGL